MNYWIVKHDRESIEDRPGWIWRCAESAESRLPPNYKRIKKRDQFILISYPYYEEDRPIHQAFGVYRVVKEVQFVKKAAPNDTYECPGAFVIRGQLLKGLKERWVTIPNISKYYAKAWTRQSVMPAKSKQSFQQVLGIFRRYCRGNINLAPLSSEPKNEQEVVALFSANLKRLGYERLRVQEAFPDAIAVKPDGKREFIEFKYYATGYDYPLKHEGREVTCVCWIDDRDPERKNKQRPKVVELRKALSR